MVQVPVHDQGVLRGRCACGPLAAELQPEAGSVHGSGPHAPVPPARVRPASASAVQHGEGLRPAHGIVPAVHGNAAGDAAGHVLQRVLVAAGGPRHHHSQHIAACLGEHVHGDPGRGGLQPGAAVGVVEAQRGPAERTECGQRRKCVRERDVRVRGHELERLLADLLAGTALKNIKLQRRGVVQMGDGQADGEFRGQDAPVFPALGPPTAPDAGRDHRTVHRAAGKAHSRRVQHAGSRTQVNGGGDFIHAAQV